MVSGGELSPSDMLQLLNSDVLHLCITNRIQHQRCSSKTVADLQSRTIGKGTYFHGFRCERRQIQIAYSKVCNQHIRIGSACITQFTYSKVALDGGPGVNGLDSMMDSSLPLQARLMPLSSFVSVVSNNFRQIQVTNKVRYFSNFLYLVESKSHLLPQPCEFQSSYMIGIFLLILFTVKASLSQSKTIKNPPIQCLPLL